MSASDDASQKTDMVIPGYLGQPVAARTLFYDHSPDREAHLVVTPDNMAVYLKLVPGGVPSALTRESLVALIAGAGVVHGLVESGLQLLINLQNHGKPVKCFCQVAGGTPMRRGENGSIEFHVQPTSMEPRYDQDDAGGIDFKQLNLIENCFAGQRVASILPPGPGRAGKDVFGNVIPPVAGEPVRVQPGPGVVMSSNGRDFTSEIEGRLVHSDNILSVSPLLEISRDIDYSVGNVDFVGKVMVRGSLLDGFYVNAKRGVEIQGDVGAGRITSEGDVTITGGIKGKHAAIITCRDLSAHYIDDASVEASGSVSATREIINSSVKALGRVSVLNGAIIGGEVCGFQGVEADTIGSDMGVATLVMAGLNWTEENRKEEIRAKVAEYLDQVQSAKVLLDPLFADKAVTSRLGSEQKSMLSDLISELREVREGLLELLEERARIDNHRQSGMVNQINVKKTIYMGVATRFSAAEGEVRDSVKGPLSLTQDVHRKMMLTGPYGEFPPVVGEEAVKAVVPPGAAGSAAGDGAPEADDGE